MAKRQHIELPAGTFSYLDQGDGPPLVLVHALGRSAADWNPVLDRLAARRRCLAVDVRGHGDSQRCDEYSFDAMESDLRAFVDALDLDAVALAGHSMGANVAWRFAARSPDRLTHLVIEDTAPPSPDQRVPEPPAEPPEPVDFDWAVVGRIIGELNAADTTWWDRLPSITTRTLLISGSTEDDHLARAHELLSDAELVHLPVGHWIHETAPEEYCDHLARFLGDGWASAGLGLDRGEARDLGC
ncbi:MAG: alpha/beta hydrolase [Actinomycetota bacterium]